MPGGATWRWSHDVLHQVREAVAPDGGVTQTEQDILGRLLSVKDPLGFTTQFRHSKNHAGPLGSVEEISRPDGVRELMRQNGEKLPESVTSRWSYIDFIKKYSFDKRNEILLEQAIKLVDEAIVNAKLVPGLDFNEYFICVSIVDWGDIEELGCISPNIYISKRKNWLLPLLELREYE